MSDGCQDGRKYDGIVLQGRLHNSSWQISSTKCLYSRSSTDKIASSLIFFKKKTQHQQSESPSVIIPTSYNDKSTGPSPGAIVGIVLGTVLGVLLLFWIFYLGLTRESSIRKNISHGNFRTSSSKKKGRRGKQKRSSSHTHSRSEMTESHRPTSSRTRSLSTNDSVRAPPTALSIPTQTTSLQRLERYTPQDQLERRPHSRDESPGYNGEIVVIEEHSRIPKRSHSRRTSRESRRSYNVADHSDSYHGSSLGRRSGRSSRYERR